MVNIMHKVTAGLWVQKSSGHNTASQKDKQQVVLHQGRQTGNVFYYRESTKQEKGSLTI